jgi:hypothetical protein
MTNPMLEAAKRYQLAGYFPIPIHPNTKVPSEANWSEPRPQWQHLDRVFMQGANIGILLGKASGGLVDVDLDCPQALALADALLVDT